MRLLKNNIYNIGKLCLVGIILLYLLDLLFPFRFEVDYSTVVKDREGNILSCYLSKDQQWRFLFENEDFNNELTNAFIQKEDKYFYYHFGINPIAICRAFINNVVYGKKTSGASTITMQVCRMLNRKPRTYSNKLIEMWNALQLEWHYSKKEILRLYFSLVPYGGNIQGIKSASILYFQKDPQALSSAQIATLCLIPNRPNTLGFGKNDALLIKERNKWIKRFHKEGLYTEDVMINALKEPIDNYKKQIPRHVPHFSRRMKHKYSKPIINTHLDPNIQNHIERISKYYIHGKKTLNINNTSVMVVDNKTREVVGYLGSSNFYDNNNSGQVDGVNAIRSPGSTLKPILFALAFDKGLCTPKSMINDIPVNFSGYEPQNYNEKFNGKLSISEALARSLNIPAVRILEKVGVESFINVLSNAGFNQIYNDKNKLGFSVILGGCGVRLEELTNLYSSMADSGKYRPLKWCNDINSKSFEAKLISPGSAFLTTDILTKLTRPDMPNNMENNVNIPQIAWKTGTSYGRRDAWSIGYNSKYTVGVWVGNFSGEGVPELSGAEMATPLLFKIFNTLQYKTTEQWFSATEDLDFRYICSESGHVPNTECKHQIIDYYLPKKSPNKKCDHYIYGYTNSDESLSFCTRCLPENGYIKKKYKNVDQELISYYDLHNITYVKQPKHNPNCERVFKENAPKIIFPEKNTEYVLFKEENQKIILKSTASNDVDNIYWFVNNKFLGKFKKGKDTFFRPEKEGEYKISCSDDKGRNSKLKIKVKFI